MCGIMGVVGTEPAVPILIDGLQHLSYRGYDAAGIAVLDGNRIVIRKTAGHLDRLRTLLDGQPVHGSIGVGHTRWATHGAPTDVNAHPHTDATERIAVVHNGIIENEQVLRTRLAAEGVVFRSQTDTEVIAHLIGRQMEKGMHRALRDTLSMLTGAYALVVLCADEPDRIYAARKDSPLVIGLGDGAQYLASDIPALLPHTREVVLLEDGDIAMLTRKGLTIWDRNDRLTAREEKKIDWNQDAADKGSHDHFMRKEINEQPEAFERLLRAPVAELPDAKSLSLVACGSAYHAGMAGQFYFGKFAALPTEVGIASEFRYRPALLNSSSLCMAVSQSGETADTLAALRAAKAQGAYAAALVNVQESSIAREAQTVQWMYAGPEIAVATTKGYTTQVLALFRLALESGRRRGLVDADAYEQWQREMAKVPDRMRQVLQDQGRIVRFATAHIAPRLIFFIGRGLDYATAMEGSLKLKEISYLHAEAYAAGELKHGALALIEQDVVVIALCTQRALLSKTLANIREVKARGAEVLAICAAQDEETLRQEVDEVWTLPDTPDELMPLLSILPLQQLAYEIALLRGCSVDKPRNLAKSVTVE